MTESSPPLATLARLKQFYSDFSASQLTQLGDIYHSELVFSDPVHRLKGLAALTDYFAHVSEQGESRFEFTHEIHQGDQTFLRWVMHYRHPRLKQGFGLALTGASFLRWDLATERVTYHEDFYDMGQMIYRHLPLLGFAIDQINARLQPRIRGPYENR
jgi:hypothetical protein